MTGRPAARMFDMCTGHKGAKPRPNDQGSPNVMINGRPAHRVGDHWMMHSGHFSFLAQGSPTVMTNGRPQGRVGDMIICTSRVMTGSPNVMVGDAAIVAPAYTGPLPSVGLDPTAPKAGSVGSSLFDRITGRGKGGSSGYSGNSIDDEDEIVDDGTGVDEPADPEAPVTADELDWIVVCMMDEALNQNTSDAWAAVARVILNRKNAQFNENRVNPDWRWTAKGIVLATNAFSGFYFEMRGGKYTKVAQTYAQAERRGLNKIARFKKNPRWNRMKEVAQKVIDGTYQGGAGYNNVRTKNALWYYNPAIIRKLPGFASAGKRVAKIEDHVFYSRK